MTPFLDENFLMELNGDSELYFYFHDCPGSGLWRSVAKSGYSYLRESGMVRGPGFRVRALKIGEAFILTGTGQESYNIVESFSICGPARGSAVSDC